MRRFLRRALLLAAPGLLAVSVVAPAVVLAEAAPAAPAAPAARGTTDRAFVSELVGAPAGIPLLGEELEARTHAVGLLLRCPVCQGSSVADSPAESAQNMKREVRDLLRQGYDTEQILRYFELAYGEFVLFEPKADGIGVLVWVGPGVALLIGVAVLFFALRRLRGQGAPAATAAAAPARDTLPDDPELAKYVERVRALTAGAPGDGGGR